MMVGSVPKSKSKSRRDKHLKNVHNNTITPTSGTRRSSVKTSTRQPLISILRLEFILLFWHKVFSLLLASFHQVRSRISRHSSVLRGFRLRGRMVSEEYSRAMESKAPPSGGGAKGGEMPQPNKLVVDEEKIRKYKKKLETLSREERLDEFKYEKEQGNESFHRSRYEQAIEHYTRCILSQPDSAVAYTNRAMAFLKVNRYTQALDDCNAALRLEPTSLKAKYRRGLALHHKNSFHEALQDFEDVVRNEPNNFIANHYVAKIREIVNTQPKRIMLLSTDMNGNSGPSPSSPPQVITISEKDRYNPKYRHCVQINEWGLPKAFCTCRDGTPEFIRRPTTSSAQAKTDLTLREKRRRLAAEDEARRAPSNSAIALGCGVPEKGDAVAVRQTRPDESVNILAKGLMRSLSKEKAVTDPLGVSTDSTAVASGSILQSTLLSPGKAADGETFAQTSAVPLIRSMPLLGDDDEGEPLGGQQTTQVQDVCQVETQSTHRDGEVQDTRQTMVQQPSEAQDEHQATDTSAHHSPDTLEVGTTQQSQNTHQTNIIENRNATTPCPDQTTGNTPPGDSTEKILDKELDKGVSPSEEVRSIDNLLRVVTEDSSVDQSEIANGKLKTKHPEIEDGIVKKEIVSEPLVNPDQSQDSTSVSKLKPEASSDKVSELETSDQTAKGDQIVDSKIDHSVNSSQDSQDKNRSKDAGLSQEDREEEMKRNISNKLAKLLESLKTSSTTLTHENNIPPSLQTSDVVRKQESVSPNESVPDSEPIKPLTKAAKRHQRRSKLSLNKQSRESSVSVNSNGETERRNQGDVCDAESEMLSHTFQSQGSKHSQDKDSQTVKSKSKKRAARDTGKDISAKPDGVCKGTNGVNGTGEQVNGKEEKSSERAVRTEDSNGNRPHNNGNMRDGSAEAKDSGETATVKKKLKRKRSGNKSKATEGMEDQSDTSNDNQDMSNNNLTATNKHMEDVLSKFAEKIYSEKATLQNGMHAFHNGLTETLDNRDTPNNCQTKPNYPSDQKKPKCPSDQTKRGSNKGGVTEGGKSKRSGKVKQGLANGYGGEKGVEGKRCQQKSC